MAQHVTNDAPDRALAWRTLALAHYHRGDWEEADIAMQQFLSQNAEPESPATLYLQAMIDRRNGDEIPALAILERAEGLRGGALIVDQSVDVLRAEANVLLKPK